MTLRRPSHRHRVTRPSELIRFEFSSCVQKLAQLRGLGTPFFPREESDVIMSFGLECCRLMAEDISRRRTITVPPPDADDDTGPVFVPSPPPLPQPHHRPKERPPR